MKKEEALLKIFEYYASENFKPELPTESKFRHFRFKTKNGTWRKAPRKIITSEELQKWIVKLGGVDIYYCATTWLNPQLVSAKGMPQGTYVVADNVMVSSDLILDIDADEPINLTKLERAKEVTRLLHECIKKHYPEDYKLEYCAFTGYKGFRLAYIDKNLVLPENPKDRLGFVENKRKFFIESLLTYLKNDVSAKDYALITKYWDTDTTLNALCVFRVLGTVNSSTGYLTVKIPIIKLKTSFKSIIQEVPNVLERRPGILKKEMTIEGKIPRPRLLQLADDVSGLASLPIHPNDREYYITNRVLGVKRGFIPILIYQDNQPYYREEIIKLQQKYSLGPAYIYQYKTNKIIVFLKIMQKRQLRKVLANTRSRTKYDFIKYNRIFAPFFMYKIEELYYTYSGQFSRGHCGYIRPTHNFDNLVGWPHIEIVKALKAPVVING